MRIYSFLAVVLLAGCSLPQVNQPDVTEPSVEPSAVLSDSPLASVETMRPVARPDGLEVVADVDADPDVDLPPPPKPVVEADAYGTTVASLGNPAEPGIWIKTPLVKKRQKGRIKAANGKEVVGDLIPIDGPATAGSRLSLAAMQALGIPLTDLPEVVISPL